MLPKISEVGRLGSDPALRYLASGKAVADLRIVFSKRKKTEAGGWVEDGSLWVKATVWDKHAEFVAESLSKGDSVIVSGELSESEWTDREGNVRKSLDLKVYDIGPVLKWNAVKVLRAERSSQSEGPVGDDPWASAPADDTEPPF